MPKNPHKNLKCSSKPTRRVSASIPATPPARALKKIINTIKCSLKSIIKHSHLEAVQWENRMQTATVSKSQESHPKSSSRTCDTECTLPQPRGTSSSLPGSSQKAAPAQARETLSLASHTHRQHVVSTSRQLLGQSKTVSGSSSLFKWIYFFPGPGRQGDEEHSAGCSCCQQLEQTPAQPQHSAFFLNCRA